MKLLMVDDEPETRKGIYENLSWKEMGISQVFQCEDGEEALKLVHQQKPDIILADVRMPRMTGTELARNVREFLPDCQIIFMSGYSDKEYLLSAIQVSAVNYVEKPLDLSELQASIRKAVKLHDNTLKLRQAERNQTSVLHNKIAVMLAHKYDYKELPEDITNKCTKIKNFLSLMFLIGKEVNEILEDIELITSKMSWAVAGQYSDNIYILHVGFNKHEEIDTLCREILKKQVSRKDLWIASGKTVSSPSQLYISWLTAQDTINRRFFYKEQQIFHYIENTPFLKAPTEISDKIVNTIFEMPLSSQFCIDELSKVLRINCGTSPELIRTIVFLIFRNARLSLPQDTPGGHVADEETAIWQSLESIDNLDDMLLLLRASIQQRIDDVKKGQISKHVSANILRYISSHFDDQDLSIDHLSKLVHLTPAYLCALFKNETGKTIKHIITDCRIHKAQELLCSSDFNIADIAKMTGYQNGNYFTKRFRYNTGMTPQQYRERNSPT